MKIKLHYLDIKSNNKLNSSLIHPMPRKPSSDADELYSSTETKSCFDEQVDAVRVNTLNLIIRVTPL